MYTKEGEKRYVMRTTGLVSPPPNYHFSFLKNTFEHLYRSMINYNEQKYKHRQLIS